MFFRKKTGIILKIILGICITAILFIGPTAFFYLKWIIPTKALHDISPDVGVQFIADDIDDRTKSKNDRLMISTRNSNGLPSVSAAIAQYGKLKWACAVGYADLRTKKPASLTTRYRLGSTSKALTGVLLARLLDKGQINLDTDAGTYISDLPAPYSALTPRMLASHTAGVRDYSGTPTYWPGWHPSLSKKNYNSVEEGLELFIHDDLIFSPGTDFEYTSYGYSLLSRLMEGATGLPFKSLLEKELFTPAGMANTAVDTRGNMKDRASFYSSSNRKFTEAYPSNSSFRIAGGGIVSTPTDVVMLGQVLLHGDFISESVKQIMWSPVRLPDGTNNPQNYALGWRVNESTLLFGEKNPTTIIHHGGLQNGGTAFYMLIPEYGVSAAVFSNTGSRSARGVVQDISYELVRNLVKLKKGVHKNELSSF